MPNALVALQEVPPDKSLTDDRQPDCAKAGEAPNTVAIPAATASERMVPPAMALAPMRRLRKLIAMPLDSSATARSCTREPFWFASIVLVRTSSPQALSSSMAAATAPRQRQMRFASICNFDFESIAA
jgi:hypothetical protein